MVEFLGGRNSFGITGVELAEIFKDSTISGTNVSELDRLYVANPNNKGGRFYAKQVQFLKSELRDYLFGDSSQMDIRNCNYSLLWSILWNMHESTDRFYAIDRVYRERDLVIQEIANEMDIGGWVPSEGTSTHAQLKELLNAMVMGKSPTTWKTDLDYDGVIPQFLWTLDAQLKEARAWLSRHSLCQRFLRDADSELDEFQRAVSVTFRVLQHLESYNMLALIQSVSEYTAVTLWVFDAIEIYGKYSGDDDTSEFLRELRPKLTASGFDHFLRLRFVDKDFSRIDGLLKDYRSMRESPMSEAEIRRTRARSFADDDAPPYLMLPIVPPAAKPKRKYKSADKKADEAAELHDYYLEQRATIESWDGVDPKRVGLVKVVSPLRFYFRDMQGKHHALSRKELVDTFENYCMWSGKGSFISAWLKDHDNATFSESGVFPDRNQRPDQYNLYTGFDVEKWEISDDDRLDPELLSLRDLYFSHMQSLVNDEQHFQWFDRWFAHMFQYPGKKVDVAGVWQSENEGNGKNIAETVIRTMLGDGMWFKTNDPDSEMFGTYNGKMENTFFGVLDESSVLKRASVEKFKNLISDVRISIRRMHTNHYESDDHNRFLLCTNIAQPVVISDSDRRFQISDSASPRLDRDLACRLSSITSNKAVMRLIYEHYMSVEVDRDHDFSRSRVLSERYMELKDKSVPHEVRFLHQYLRDLQLNPPSASAPNWVSSASSSSVIPSIASPPTVVRSLMELYRDYSEYMKQCGLADSVINHVVSIDYFGDRIIGTLHIPRSKFPLAGEFSNTRGDISKNVDSESGIHYFLSNHRNKYYRKVVWHFDVARAVRFLDTKYPRM